MSTSQTKVTYRPPAEGEPPYGGIAGVPQADLDEATWQRLPAHIKTSVIGQTERYAVPKAWRDAHVAAEHDALDVKDALRRDLLGLREGEVDPSVILRDGLAARPAPEAPTKATAPTKDAPKEAVNG